jgi:rod shape-determining protein MreD
MTVPIRGMDGDERLLWSAERWRMLVPVLTCIAALFIMTLPIVTPSPSVPHLALLTVLIWSLFQPALMPPYIAFPLGILTDAVLGLPIGVNATLMPALAIAIGALDRRFGHRPYLLDWLISGAVIVAYQYLSWHLLGVVAGDLPFAPLLGQAATTILTYPLGVAIIARLQRRWVEAR